MLGDRLGRLILPALLAIYGAASALFQLLSTVGQQGLPAEPYLLPVVPALSTTTAPPARGKVSTSK